MVRHTQLRVQMQCGQATMMTKKKSLRHWVPPQKRLHTEAAKAKNVIVGGCQRLRTSLNVGRRSGSNFEQRYTSESAFCTVVV